MAQMILGQLNTLDILRLDLEEMVELDTHVAAVVATSARYQLDTPDWLVEAQRTLQRVIRQKHDALLALRRQEAKQRLQKQRSPEARRAGLEQAIAALEAQGAATPA